MRRLPLMLERLAPYMRYLFFILVLAIVLLAVSSGMLTGPEGARYSKGPALITYLEPWQRVLFMALAFLGAGYAWVIVIRSIARTGGN